MPTFRITDPGTGRVLNVTGDSPPSEQELEELFASQSRAVSPALLEQQRAELFQELAEKQGPLEAFGIGAGRGLTAIGRGLGLADQPTEGEQRGIEALREARPIATTAGEITGQAAPFLVPGVGISGLAGTGARVAATAGLGALEGGLITRGEGGDLSGQLMGAGVGGAVAGTAELLLPGIARAGSKLIRRALGKVPEGQVIDAAGNPSAEFVEALNRSGLTIDDIAQQERLALAGQAVDPEQAARKAFLETQGVKPTRAQVTRDAGEFQAQQEAAKAPGKVRTALEEQEAFLTSRFDNAVIETGGEAVTPTSTVSDALVNKATALDSEISSLYRQAREVAPGAQNVSLTTIAGRLKSLQGQDRATGGAIRAVTSDLIDKGVIDKDLKIIGKLDVEAAEDARKVMNQLFDPQQPFRNIKLRELKDALDDDVFKSAGGDVFKQARKAKSDFERGLSRAKVSKFDSRKQNLVRDVLENKINPDQLADKVVFGKTYRPDDLQQLKDYISTDEAGASAFNDLRAEVMQSIKEKVFIGAEDAAGNKALSRDKLQKALASIGKKKMDVLFSADEQRFLDDMLKVARLREPVRGTAIGQGPSAQAVNRLRAEIRKGSIVANLLDSVTFDGKGKAILKAKPERVVKDISPTARQAQQALAQTGAVGAVAATQQNQ